MAAMAMGAAAGGGTEGRGRGREGGERRQGGARASPLGERGGRREGAVRREAREAEAGAGMMDCKKALVDNAGDYEAATEFLRKKGLASAEKKSGRATKEGIIETCAPGYGAPPRAASRASLHRLHAAYD